MEAESLVKRVFLIAFIHTKTERELLSTEKQHAALCFFTKTTTTAVNQIYQSTLALISNLYIAHTN